MRGPASCCRCGGTDGVELVIDPYVLEMDGVEVWIYICPTCFAYRCEES